MNIRAKRLLSLVSVGVAGIAASGFVLAEGNYPDRPIQLVVGYGAGGGTDTCFRALAHSAAKTLGQNIVIENKPGAGSSLSVAYIARQKPDGYIIGALPTGAVG